MDLVTTRKRLTFQYSILGRRKTIPSLEIPAGGIQGALVENRPMINSSPATIEDGEFSAIASSPISSEVILLPFAEIFECPSIRSSYDPVQQDRTKHTEIVLVCGVSPEPGKRFLITRIGRDVTDLYLPMADLKICLCCCRKEEFFCCSCPSGCYAGLNAQVPSLQIQHPLLG
ncbi:hypothetical protein AKJ16_DCAP01189 [Drosera capensis]